MIVCDIFHQFISSLVYRKKTRAHVQNRPSEKKLLCSGFSCTTWNLSNSIEMYYSSWIVLQKKKIWRGWALQNAHKASEWFVPALLSDRLVDLSLYNVPSSKPQVKRSWRLPLTIWMSCREVVRLLLVNPLSSSTLGVYVFRPEYLNTEMAAIKYTLATIRTHCVRCNIFRTSTWKVTL